MTELATRVSVDDAERALLTGEAPADVASAEEATRDIVIRLLQAESDAELNAAMTAYGAQEILGIPHTVNDVRWLRSAFDEGNAVFAVMDATNEETGERYAVTCSSSNVLASLINLSKRARFPVSVTVQRSEKATANGFYPLRLTVNSNNGSATPAE